MKIQKEKTIRFAAYTLFGLIMFSSFLVLTFPFDLIEKELRLTLQKESGCQITTQKSEFGLPARFSWQGIKASCPQQLMGAQEGQLNINLTSLDLRLAPLPLLFKQKGEIDFQVGSEIGNILGHLIVAKKGERFSFLLRTEGRSLDIKETGLSGLLSIKGESEWTDQAVLKGIGRISFTVEKGRFKAFGGWSLPLGEIVFSNIEGQFFWKNGRVVLEQFSAKGETVDLQSDSGTVFLRNPQKNSLLTLSLRATPKGSLKEMAGLFIQGYNGRKPLKIRMNGPLRAPKISINGKAAPLKF